MHLKITKVTRNGRTLEYAKIVQSYREDHRVKQRVLKNLGRVRSPDDLRRFREVLEAMRREEKVFTFSLGSIRLSKTYDFGIVYATEKLWDSYGISRVLEEALSDGRFKFDVVGIVRLLVAHRLHEPSSDLSAYEWMREEAFTGLESIRLQQVYRALDYLIERRERIEVGIFRELQRKLGLKADLVFYDLTSSYFEGDGPELAEYGYSRDRRPDRKQLVLALALIDGIPIFHEVFEGDTADRATLRHAVGKLKEKFEIGRIIFVADRGLFSGENLDFLEEEKYEFIIATKRRWNKEIEKLMLTPLEGKGEVFAQEVKREGNRRYILCINRETEREEREHLLEVRRFLERKLKELSDSWAAQGAGRRPSKENLLGRALKILGRHRRLFDLKFDGKLTYSLNREAWEYENAIAGRFLLVTTSDLEAGRVMESYKELCKVERAFREIKDFLGVRPIYHSEDRRVRAHVFVCVLSYLTEALIGKLVPYQSARKTIRWLDRIKVTEMSIGEERIFLVREMKSRDLKIFESLGIEAPPKYIEM
jgi:transposase